MGNEPPASYADIAVALTLASSKLDLDMANYRRIAERIGLSKMGLSTVIDGIERDAMLVRQAVEIFKKLSEAEPEVKSLLARKSSGRWFPRLARTAAL